MLDKNIFGEVPEEVHDAVVIALKFIEKTSDTDNVGLAVCVKNQKKGNQSRFRIPRIAVAGLAGILLSGITVSAMEIVNLYKQRMVEMNEELLEEYYNIADSGEATEFNRSLSSEEEVRYHQLSEEYENNGLFPTENITYMQNADEYNGEGIALDSSNRTLYLPDKELSDEELLELIDFEHKICYSVYEKNQERLANGENWESRMAKMDDQQVDEIYQTVFSGNSEISGAYSRELSADENARYEKLVKQYEEEGLYAMTDLTVIQTAEEYTGEGVAVCVENSTYYLPENEVTDEELLQIIDLQHKAVYCCDRIGQEIEMGLRCGYPGY